MFHSKESDPLSPEINAELPGGDSMAMVAGIVGFVGSIWRKLIRVTCPLFSVFPISDAIWLTKE